MPKNLGAVKFEVVYSIWGAGDDEVFEGGVHERENPSKDLLRHLAGAEASGVVNVLEASPEARAVLDGHVQSQEDGEAAQVKAMGEWVDDEFEEHLDGDGNVVYRTLKAPGFWPGPWRHGNLTHFVSSRRERLALDSWMKEVGPEKVAELQERAVELGETVLPDPLTDEERATLETLIARAEADLEKTEVPQ